MAVKQLLAARTSTSFVLFHGARSPPGPHDAYDRRSPPVSHGHRCGRFLVTAFVSTMPLRHRVRYSAATRNLSTIILERCPRLAGNGVHVALETLSFITRNNHLAADGGMSWWLPRKIGHARAVEMLIGSRRLSATEAQEIGLISAVIDGAEESFVASVVDRAQGLCRGTRDSRAASLALLREGSSRSLADQLTVEAGAMGDLAGSDWVRARVLALQ
jgi:hypothetical protein